MGNFISIRVLIAVFVRVSGLLRHRIIRADLPIAGIPYGHAETALKCHFAPIRNRPPELVQRLVVQVKSYQGTLNDPSAVNDIRRAFDAYDNADMGLIVSTAKSASHAVQDELDRLREESEKPAALLISDDLAVFFLRHG